MTPFQIDLSITLGVIAASVATYVLASRHAARPADPLKPRLVPWRGVILASGLVGVLGLVHLVNLFGVETGAR